MSETARAPFSIPLFLFGVPEVGKTSFLLSMAYSLRNGGASRSDHWPFQLHMQESAHGYFDELGEAWQGAKLARTRHDQPCGFVAQMGNGPRVCFSVHDYDGNGAKPNSKSNKGKRKDDEARALVFIVDQRHVSVGSRPPLKSQSAWYATRLAEFAESNRDRRHPPVVLLINKVDLIFAPKSGEKESAEVALLRERPYLIPNGVDRQTIALGIPGESVPTTAFDRLVQCVMQDSHIARSMRLQQFAWKLLHDYRVFFEEVIKRTFRFQVFFSMCDGKLAGQDAMSGPFGVIDPIQWTVSELYAPYLQQGEVILKRQFKTLSEQRDLLARVAKSMKQTKAAQIESDRPDQSDRALAAAEIVLKKAQEGFDKAVEEARKAKLLPEEGDEQVDIPKARRSLEKNYHKVRGLIRDYQIAFSLIEPRPKNEYVAVSNSIVEATRLLKELLPRLHQLTSSERPGDKKDRAVELTCEVKKSVEALEEAAGNMQFMGESADPLAPLPADSDEASPK